jgi:hypothetical protein
LKKNNSMEKIKIKAKLQSMGICGAAHCL